MIKDQALDEMKPYPQCYESLSVIHKPYVPDTSHVGIARYSIEVAIVPNPVEDVGFVSSNNEISGYQILNGLGVAIESMQFGEGMNRFSIPMNGKPSGLYYVILYAKGNKQNAVRKLIKS